MIAHPAPIALAAWATSLTGAAPTSIVLAILLGLAAGTVCGCVLTGLWIYRQRARSIREYLDHLNDEADLR
jgi:spore maturation protein SpmA